MGEVYLDHSSEFLISSANQILFVNYVFYYKFLSMISYTSIHLRIVKIRSKTTLRGFIYNRIKSLGTLKKIKRETRASRKRRKSRLKPDSDRVNRLIGINLSNLTYINPKTYTIFSFYIGLCRFAFSC